MMEMGELGADVMPAFGTALREIANQGGALETVLDSARVTQSRFITQSQKGADLIFKSGFEEGISGLFKTLTEGFKDSEDGLKGLGKTYRLFFNIINNITKALVFVLNELFTVLGDVSDGIEMAFGKGSIGVITAFGAAAAVALSPLLRIVTAITIALDEISALFVKGKIGVVEKALGMDLSGEQFKDQRFGALSAFPAFAAINAGMDMLTPSTPTATPTTTAQAPVQNITLTVNEDGSGTSRQIIQETLGGAMHLPN